VRSLRVLIAEDESIIRIGLCRILEDAGYQVVAAPDGHTAVKLARQTGPGLVILDIKMPNLDGLETARRIYGHRPVPIIILTAYGDQELVKEAADLPIMAYLIKPVNEQELLATAEIVTARFDEQQQVIQHAAELENQLAGRKLVEQAKGLLMKQDSLSEEEAYRRIQRQARQERRPMQQVAQEIVRQHLAGSPGGDGSN